ncbi:sensor histidine kinase [Roseiterribacter gracilis]|uniref:histidine kinase n=1 Tax=Roseiterribacter gracilis TaxID=2812848 RepID=A0A8S8X9A3_9PROT|nr:two-component sensor histidine kinase [Rhodospirillales bacterium TMPK1]
MKDDRRPSPDALLERAARERSGKLKIYLGAAPGVGKTYEMLEDAWAKRRDGVDVVIGVVETHARPETEALLPGLEVIERREIEHRGVKLHELDLDAILARRPALVLVDELAHTNAPGSRHPKRYQDVEELLAAGIDVWSCMNVQHVESLNDVVASITRVRVRETVPDSILDRADEIELVDLPPDDLMQRLREGKVYVADAGGERALANFFQPGNLTALRELALRRAAQRVDQQMQSWMRAHAVEGPWAAGEHVLVALSPARDPAALVRAAKLLADRLHASLTAIHVDTHRAIGPKMQARLDEALRLAERLGGTALSVPGQSAVDEILAYARDHNVTQIVLGASTRGRWIERVFGSTVHELVRRAGPVSVHLIAADAAEPERGTRQIEVEPPRATAWAASVLLVAAALGVGLVIEHFTSALNVSLAFLTAVVAAAAIGGRGPALFACVLSVGAYNFFFLPPIYTFTITEPENIVALFFFFIVAVLVSNLSARQRMHAVSARRQARIQAELYAFSRKIAGVVALDDLLWTASVQIASALDVRVVFLLPDRDGLRVAAGFPPEDTIDAADMAAARWSFAHARPAGRDADTLPGAKRLFLPLIVGGAVVAVVGIDRDAPGQLLSPDRRRLLETLLDQTASAIERVGLAGKVEATRLEAETERLRAALLTSISHDLRTPLVSITGAVSSLRGYGDSYDPAQRDELLRTVEEEAARLNRFISNLLAMTRLESGTIDAAHDAVDLEEVVGTALERVRPVLDPSRISFAPEGDLPAVRGDYLLLEQVLVNLLDNAAKYAVTDEQTAPLVTITARRDGDVVQIDLADNGPGIPAADLERVFDKFYRVREGDRRRAGTGLGLAICRGFVEAMGGTIKAVESANGAHFVVRLPVSQ